MPSLDEQLRFAIINKRLVQITYHGGVRIGEPHDYGIHHSAPKLLFYQLRRASDNDRWEEKTGWRLLEVAKIDACTVAEKTFPGSRGQLHRQHLTWDKLFVRVAESDSKNPPRKR
jgi:hypothetical protein